MKKCFSNQNKQLTHIIQDLPSFVDIFECFNCWYLSSNFNEAVDELFQHLFVDECMKWCQHLNRVLIAYSPLTKNHFRDTFTADPSSSFNEAVDKLFQHSFVDECMEIMSILLSSAYCLFCFKKKRIFNVSTADASSSFNEAVDELFQHLLVKKI